MPRPQLHPTDAMLDAARGVVLEAGPRATTIEAIAAASGAPTGSIYHRFRSRDELLATLWIRAVRRSQDAFAAAAAGHDDPRQAALAAAASIIEFCEEQPDDAQLLVSLRREDLIQAVPDGPLADELQQLNRPVEKTIVQLAQRLYGRRTRAAIERTLLAVFDLPYGAARRHLIAGERMPPGLREDVTRAVRAVLDGPPP